MKETAPRLPSPERAQVTLDEALDRIGRFAFASEQGSPYTHSFPDMQQSIDVAASNLSDPKHFPESASMLLFALRALVPNRYPNRKMEKTTPFEEAVGLYALEEISRRSNFIKKQIQNKDNRYTALSLVECMVAKFYKNDDIRQRGISILHRHVQVVQQGIRDDKIDCIAMIPAYLTDVGQDARVIQQTIDDIMRNGKNVEQIAMIFEYLRGSGTPYPSYLFSDFVKKYIRILTERFGYAAERQSLMKVWAESCEEADHTTMNIIAMCRLEFQEPGCTKYFMKEFGIRCFARYPLDMLINQYRHRDDTQSPYGLVIFPYKDHNGAFYQSAPLFQSLEKQFEDIAEHDGPTYRIRIVECQSLYEIGKAIVKSAGAYGKIHFAIIGGHGNPTRMEFSWDGILTKKQIEEGKGIQRIGKFFIPNSTVILASCSTGRKNGLAQAMSKIGESSRVIAPRTPTTIRTITVQNRDNSLQFNVIYERSPAALYKSGNDAQIVP